MEKRANARPGCPSVKSFTIDDTSLFTVNSIAVAQEKCKRRYKISGNISKTGRRNRKIRCCYTTRSPCSEGEGQYNCTNSCYTITGEAHLLFCLSVSGPICLSPCLKAGFKRGRAADSSGCKVGMGDCCIMGQTQRENCCNLRQGIPVDKGKMCDIMANREKCHEETSIGARPKRVGDGVSPAAQRPMRPLPSGRRGAVR